MPDWLQFLEFTYKEGEFSLKLGPVFTVVLLVVLGVYIWRFFRSGGMLKPKSVKVNTPLGEIELEVDRSEQIVAWKLYVEIVTRGATQPLALGQGDLCSSVESIHKLFTITRDLLQDTIPPRRTDDCYSVGLLGVQMLNTEMRAFLTRWHPRIALWQNADTGGEELAKDDQLYRESLKNIQNAFHLYALAFAKIANITEEVHNEMLPLLTLTTQDS